MKTIKFIKQSSEVENDSEEDWYSEVEKYENDKDCRRYITYKDISEAYWSCLRHKKNKESAIRYTLNYEMNNLKLMDELNEGRYQIGTSNCFCVTRPKIREVFAANFRDRIVHHLLMNKTLHMFEENFNPHTYSCRVGKGVLYGVTDIKEQIERIGWDKCNFVKIDISGFFMSIDKDILFDKIKKLMEKNWNVETDGNNMEWWIELTKMIVMNRPEKNCRKTGDVLLFNKLPPHKTLFKSNGKGLPIGNLTSQIFANFYLSEIDEYISKRVQGYGRYVDDIIMLDEDRTKMLKLLPEIRNMFSKLNLVLNEHKTIAQTAYKGVPFIGYIIKKHGVYTGKNLRNQSLKASCIKNVPLSKMFCRMNSYFGFLKYCASYWLRCILWRNLTRNYPKFAVEYGMGKIMIVKKLRKRRRWWKRKIPDTDKNPK